MTKYRVVHGSSSVEFADLSEAEAYQSTIPGAQLITVEEPDPPEQFAPITARQIRLQLLTFEITEDMIVTALGTLPSPTKEAALIEWGFSSSFERTHPLVDVVGTMLEWSVEDLDGLWREAIKL